MRVIFKIPLAPEGTISIRLYLSKNFAVSPALLCMRSPFFNTSSECHAKLDIVASPIRYWDLDRSFPRASRTFWGYTLVKGSYHTPTSHYVQLNYGGSVIIPRPVVKRESYFPFALVYRSLDICEFCTTISFCSDPYGVVYITRNRSVRLLQRTKKSNCNKYYKPTRYFQIRNHKIFSFNYLYGLLHP